MGRSKLSKLALAIAATALIVGPMTARAYEMDARQVVQSIGKYVSAGQIDSAIELVARLRALGITQIQLGGTVVSVAEIERAVRSAGSDPASAQLIAQFVAVAQAASAASFFAGTVAVAAVQSTDVLPDNFPTGSAGAG